jgi:hypothetical protein
MTTASYSSRAGRYQAATVEVIASLTGSLVHQVAAELVRRHRLGGNGRCVSCGQPSPCPVRESAARTCLYAGDDPEALRSSAALPLTRDVRDQEGRR